MCKTVSLIIITVVCKTIIITVVCKLVLHTTVIIIRLTYV